MRDRLAGVLDARALLPAVRVRSTVRPLAVLNRDAKTVVRLELERRRGGGRARRGASALAPRLHGRSPCSATTPSSSGRCACCATGSASRRPSARCSTRRCAPPAAARGHLLEARIELARGTRADEAAGVGAARGCWRSPRRTCPGRSTTSTPSSCTTCASPSGARGRCCASSRACTRPAARPAARRAQWAQTLTGPVRDLDVAAARVGRARRRCSRPSARPQLEPLRALLARRRARELTELRRGLRSADSATCSPPGARSPRGRGAARRPAATPRGRSRWSPASGSARSTGGWCATARAIDDDTPARGAPRPAQARQGAALPARAVRQPVPGRRRQADGLDAQGPAGACSGRFQDRAVQIELLRRGARRARGRARRPATLMALGSLLDALLADQQRGARRVRRAFDVRRVKRAPSCATLPEADA